MKELQKNPLPPSLSEHPPAKEPPLSASKPSFTIKSISNLLLKPANTKRSVLPSLILSVPVNPISSKVSGQVNPVPVPQTKIEVIPDQENRQKKTADAKASSHSHGKKSGKPKAPRAPPEMEMNAWAAKSKPSYKLQYMP